MASVFIFCRTGSMVNRVRKMARLMITVLGGVFCRPIACLSIDRTMTILVKEVMTIRIAGARLRTVRTAIIWRAVLMFSGFWGVGVRFMLIPGRASSVAVAVVVSSIVVRSVMRVFSLKFKVGPAAASRGPGLRHAGMT